MDVERRRTFVQQGFTVVEKRGTDVEHRWTNVEMRRTLVEHRRMDVEHRWMEIEMRWTGVEHRLQASTGGSRPVVFDVIRVLRPARPINILGVISCRGI